MKSSKKNEGFLEKKNAIFADEAKDRLIVIPEIAI